MSPVDHPIAAPLGVLTIFHYSSSLKFSSPLIVLERGKVHISLEKRKERRSSEMKEMITRNRAERLTGDRTDRPHYIKRMVEFR